MQSAVAEKFDYNEDLLLLISKWYDNPLLFCKECLGVSPSEQQTEALLQLPKCKKLSIRSGHGPGKDAFASWAILWFLITRAYAKVICTAPTARQLSVVLWSEISKWLRNSLVSAEFEIQKDKIFMKGAKNEWFAVAVTTSVKSSAEDQAEALAGFHAEHILVVVDEASGVPDPVYIPLEGILTQEDNRVILIGNPTRAEGYFYETHVDKKLEKTWKRLVWNSEDSTNVAKGYCEEMERKYGKDSNVYRVRVLGEFPERSGDSFIPYDLVEGAIEREIDSQLGKPKVMTVDVARMGSDKTVILTRQGDLFLEPRYYAKLDLMQVVDEVVEEARKQNPVEIRIDAIGLGAGVFDRLNQLGYPVVAVNVSEVAAKKPSVYTNLRAELWGLARDWLDSRVGKITDTPDGDLSAQLSTVRYKFDTKNRYIIESKKEMRSRGVSSPDFADAFVMHFVSPAFNPTGDFDEFEKLLAFRVETGIMALDAEAGW